MARSPVREVSAPSAIRPMAAPVNTYVRPAEPSPSGLEDLARGLAAFDQGLGAFLNKRKGETEESDKARAMRDFHKNNQVGYADAVRQGLIPAQASKSYMEWYKRSQGDLAGLKLRDKFRLDYQQWGERNDSDSAGYATWVSDWMSQNVGDDQDGDVLRGLAPHLEALSTSGMDTFVQERDQKIKADANATTGARFADSASRISDDAKSSGEIDGEGLWGNYLNIRKEAIDSGSREEDIDAAMVDAVILQAKENGDDDILDILDRKLPGKDYSLSSTPDIKSKIMAAKSEIATGQRQAITEGAAVREREEKAQQEEFWFAAIGHIQKGEAVPEDLIQKMKRRDGDVEAKIVDYRKKFSDFNETEDSKQIIEIFTRIDEGAGKDFIRSMAEKGTIKSATTLEKMYSRAEAVTKAKQDDGIFGTSTYKSVEKFVTTKTGVASGSLFEPTGPSAETLEAMYDYRTKLLTWSVENPNAGVLEREKAAKEIGDTIMGRLQADPTDVNGKQTYQSDADLAKAKEAPAPTPEAAAPVEAPEEGSGWADYLPGIPSLDRFFEDDAEDPQEQPQAAPGAQEAQPQADTPEQAAKPLQDLSEGQRKAVEDFASKRGITVEEANDLLGRRVKQLMGGQDGVDNTVTNSIPEETKTKLTALFSDPPKVQQLQASNVPVAPILNLIGKTEGTDKGDGYNETLGYGAYTGGDVNLVGMTLGDIDRLQTQMLRHPNNRWNSSAIGRYQIVRTTLRKLKKRMGATDDMVFDKNMQDRMAMELLKGRGLEDWQAGRMSDSKFINGLAKEWASLPNSSGRGHYKGQGTGTTVGGLMSALGETRNKRKKTA